MVKETIASQLNSFGIRQLAKLIGHDKFGALGRLSVLLEHCLSLRKYCLTREEIEFATECEGTSFPDHLVTAGLAEHLPDGSYLIMDAKDPVERSVRRAEASRKGAQASASIRSATTERSAERSAERLVEKIDLSVWQPLSDSLSNRSVTACDQYIQARDKDTNLIKNRFNNQKLLDLDLNSSSLKPLTEPVITPRAREEVVRSLAENTANTRKPFPIIEQGQAAKRLGVRFKNDVISALNMMFKEGRSSDEAYARKILGEQKFETLMSSGRWLNWGDFADRATRQLASGFGPALEKSLVEDYEVYLEGKRLKIREKGMNDNRSDLNLMRPCRGPPHTRNSIRMAKIAS